MTSQQPTEYEIARDRVEADAELNALRDVILDTNWTEADHWNWVATADRTEILAWARAIARDRADAE